MEAWEKRKEKKGEVGGRKLLSLQNSKPLLQSEKGKKHLRPRFFFVCPAEIEASVVVDSARKREKKGEEQNAQCVQCNDLLWDSRMIPAAWKRMNVFLFLFSNSLLGALQSKRKWHFGGNEGGRDILVH